MFPEGCLLAPDGKVILSFEKDPINPLNEGFIEFWSVIHSNSKQFIYRKRISKVKALDKWTYLAENGWKVFDEGENVA